MNVVLVPLIGVLFWRERLRRALWVGILLVLGGLWLLAMDHVTPTQPASLWGDSLVLVGAVMFAGHIVTVGRLSHDRSLLALNAVQLSTVAILASGTSLLIEGVPSLPSAAVWWSALYLGVVATALVMGLQLVAQRIVTPTETALIFVLEPVFAALFAWAFGGEQLTGRFLVSGALMLGGILLAELPPPGRTPASLD